MKLTVPPLEIDCNEGFSSGKDIFERERFGRNIFNIIENVKDELVIAVDAPWGEGKTTFIKMWRGMLSKEGIESIYFDAFENDYQIDPFLAIAAEIYSIIDDDRHDAKLQFKMKTISAMKTLGKVSLRVGIKAATAGILDETIFDDTNTIKDVSKEASDLVDSYVSKKLENAKRDKKNLFEFKKSLDVLASNIGKDKPLVFIVDELDRCKPPFALAILENIKHLFSVKNIVFVLVMNRTQIEESIKCEYGAGVEASKYLQKFVHLWASLPKNKSECKCDGENYVLDCLERMNFSAETQAQNIAIKTYKQLVTHYDLSFREIERSLTNYSLLHNMTAGRESECLQLMFVYLSIIKVIEPEIYSRISNGNIDYEELLNKTNLNTLEDEQWLSNYFIDRHPIKFLLHYCLSNEEEFENHVRQSIEVLNYKRIFPNQSRRILETSCKWMNTFEAI